MNRRPPRPYREPLFNPLEILVGITLAVGMVIAFGGVVIDWLKA